MKKKKKNLVAFYIAAGWGSYLSSSTYTQHHYNELIYQYQDSHESQKEVIP